MKTTLLKLLCVIFLCALASPFALAGGQRVDLSTRRAVYFTGNKSVIDLKNDKYVAAGGTITVKKAQAVSCEGNTCTFNLGAIAFRSGGAGTLSTYGQFAVKTVGTVGNTILFNGGENTRQHVLPVKLMVGRNTVAFTIDPENKLAETDENNNSISVTITVE